MRSMGAVIVLATAPETPPRVKSTRNDVSDAPSFAMVVKEKSKGSLLYSSTYQPDRSTKSTAEWLG